MLWWFLVRLYYSDEELHEHFIDIDVQGRESLLTKSTLQTENNTNSMDLVMLTIPVKLRNRDHQNIFAIPRNYIRRMRDRRTRRDTSKESSDFGDLNPLFSGDNDW